MQYATFFDLPTEIQCQILRLLLPIDRTLRLKTRDPNALKVKVPKEDFYGRMPWPKPYPYEPKPEDFEESSMTGSGIKTSPLSLLLIHSTVTKIVSELIGSSNSFSFPDVFTIRSFIRQKVGSICSSNITSMSIDARGPVTLQQGRKWSRYRFCKTPDLDIAEVIKLFPRLEDLSLGGIGPGAQMIEGASRLPADEYETLMRFYSSVWDVEHLTLIARIIGVYIADAITSTATPNATYDRPSASSRSSGVTACRASPLEGARVIYYQNRCTWTTQAACGLLQYHGIRILRPGLTKEFLIPYRDNDIRASYLIEMELTDLEEAFQKARCLSQEHEAYAKAGPA